MPDGMTDHEITRLVNRYIGVSGGYLGLPERFSYRTHGDFYSEYCDLEVSFEGHEGTTRETFMSILASLPREIRRRSSGASSSGSRRTNRERRPPGRPPTRRWSRLSPGSNRGRS